MYMYASMDMYMDPVVATRGAYVPHAAAHGRETSRQLRVWFGAQGLGFRVPIRGFYRESIGL